MAHKHRRKNGVVFACDCDDGERLAGAESECLEQARLNGMGSERELRLQARLAETDELRVKQLRQQGDAWAADAARYKARLVEAERDRDAAQRSLSEHSKALLAAEARLAEVKRILATGLSHAGQRNHIALLLEAADSANACSPSVITVPVKPTQAMLYAMAELDGWKRGDREHPMLTRWEDYWTAALSALPGATNSAPAARCKRCNGGGFVWIVYSPHDEEFLPCPDCTTSTVSEVQK